MFICSVINEGALGGEVEESQEKLSIQPPTQLEYPLTPLECPFVIYVTLWHNPVCVQCVYVYSHMQLSIT